MAKSIIFVDSRVSNYQSLIASLTEPSEVFVLNGDSDGLSQMASALLGRSGIDAIHVISHGSQGTLYLGSTVLNGGSLGGYKSQLASIGSALTAEGDILLYGCNVAQGDVGLQFIDSLAKFTGADVAASDDSTGAALLGGDWVLERVSGSVETTNLLVNRLAGLLVANTAPMFSESGGRVTTDFFGSVDVVNNIVLQPDGKIVMGGSALNSSGYSYFAMARYNSDGSLDISFDGDGKLTTDLGSVSKGNSLILQTDGKLVMGGYCYSLGYSQGPRYALARYNSDGSLDTSFSGDGKLTNEPSLVGIGYSVTLQSDGRILLGGDNTSGGSYDFALSRYNSNGSLDNSFDGDGIAITAFEPFGGWSTDSGHGIAMQADGKILLGGTSANSFAMTRYNSDGSLDTCLDGDGKLTTNFPSGVARGYSVVVQADGKILLAGTHYVSGGVAGVSRLTLVRYNSDGSLDISFDGDGIATTSFSNSTGDWGYGVTVQTDGKILLGGRFGSSAALARYNSDGSLDTSFDGDGQLVTSINCGPEGTSCSFAVQPDGKIVVGGTSYEGSNYSDFALVRYNGDGSTDNSFFPASKTLTASSSFTENQSEILVNPYVQISDKEMVASGSYAGASLTLERHNGANTQDVFSAVSGALTPGSSFAVDNASIGQVTANRAGTLTLTFNANATQSLLNKAMQQITYANTSDAPPASVQIDWLFNDGNSGAQGSGGSLTAMGRTTINIAATNDAPTGTVVISGTTALSQTLTASNSLADRDGIGTVSYQWNAANVAISGATSHVLTIGPEQVGKTITVTASYTDGYGTRESVSSAPTLAVVNDSTGTVTGSSANDLLTSNKSNDTIDGGAGTDTAIFTGKITDYYIKYNRALGTATATITDHRTSGDGTDSLKNIEKLQFGDKTFELLNPARTESAAFGKSQSFLFDPSFYLLKNPDLVPTVTLATAFDSYKSKGAAAGAAPNAWFDPVYYANRWLDLKSLNLDAATLFAHYNLYGVWEGRSAGPTFDKFDGTKYLNDNKDVADYVDAFVKDFLGSRSNGAIAHYIIYGANEGRVAYDTTGVVIEQAILIGTP